MTDRVEFIESYVRIGSNYRWSDNHGELVRCRYCAHCDRPYEWELYCTFHARDTAPERFCSEGVKKDADD